MNVKHDILPVFYYMSIGW